MATPDVLKSEQDPLIYASFFDNQREDNVKSRGSLIEKKLDFLESLAGNVSNRRARRWLNDRILMELVPRLNVEEIRGLFSPPPWGEQVHRSAFTMAKMEDWDKFRNIDMDKEASIIQSMENTSSKHKYHLNADKAAVVRAWHRVDTRTREALRRCYLLDVLNGYEECVGSFAKNGSNVDTLELKVQDPFHRLLLHGVCEFYNLVSSTQTQTTKGSNSLKITSIKKKTGSLDIPPITLCDFLKMAKSGSW